MDNSASTSSDEETFYDCVDETQKNVKANDKNGEIEGKCGAGNEGEGNAGSLDLNATKALQTLTLQDTEESRAAVDNGLQEKIDVAEGSTNTLGGSSEQLTGESIKQAGNIGKLDQNAQYGSTTADSTKDCDPLVGSGEHLGQVKNDEAEQELPVTAEGGASGSNEGYNPQDGTSEHFHRVDNTNAIGESKRHTSLEDTSEHVDVNDERTAGAIGGSEGYNPLAGAGEHGEQADNNANSSDESDDESNMTQEEIDGRAEEAKKLKNEGNIAYKNENFSEAERLYTEGLKICPKCLKKDRAVLYSNRSATFVKMNDKTESAIEDCTNAIELHSTYLKAILRRAQLYEKTEKFEEAIKDYERVLELDPSIHSARAALQSLPDEIEKRNERLKAQMMSSLKDLGNLFLRPFGLSTDNFQMQQDPNTGSYNVQFNNNPAQQNNGAPGNGPTNGR